MKMPVSLNFSTINQSVTLQSQLREVEASSSFSPRHRKPRSVAKTKNVIGQDESIHNPDSAAPQVQPQDQDQTSNQRYESDEATSSHAIVQTPTPGHANRRAWSCTSPTPEQNSRPHARCDRSPAVRPSPHATPQSDQPM